MKPSNLGSLNLLFLKNIITTDMFSDEERKKKQIINRENISFLLKKLSIFIIWHNKI